MWNGAFTDVPVMGYDATDEKTLFYTNIGDMPTFKLYRPSTKEFYSLSYTDSVQPYAPQSVSTIEQLSMYVVPTSINLYAPYPNPFNPSTTIEYSVPIGGAEINISIYDIQGREVLSNQLGFREGNTDFFSLPVNFLSSIMLF